MLKQKTEFQSNVLDNIQKFEKNETGQNKNAKGEQEVDNNRKMSQERK